MTLAASSISTTVMATISTQQSSIVSTGCTSATMFLSTEHHTTTSSKSAAKHNLSSNLEEEYELKEDKDKASSSSRKKSKKQKIRMPQRKGGMQLWQFLYALLEDPEKRYGEMIEWTDNRTDLEFRLLDPEAIAIWWGNIKHRANMTYERLSRSLRYYYDRGILKKMGGERYLYRFCVDPEEMYKHIGNSDSRPILKPMPLQVTKWMYTRMMMPHSGVFFPSNSPLAPPEYSAAVLQQSTQQQQPSIPPPPPYPGLLNGGFTEPPQFYLPCPSPLSYDYHLTHLPAQETTEVSPYHIHYETTSASFQEIPVPFSEPIFVATNNAIAAGCFNTYTTSSILCPGSPPESTSIGTTDHSSVGYQFNPLPLMTSSHQQSTVETAAADPGSSLYYDGGATSPLYSGSTCSGGECEMAELDEILPILASMEQSDELLSSSQNSSLSASPTAGSPPYTPSGVVGHIISPSSSSYSTAISTHYSPTYTNHAT